MNAIIFAVLFLLVTFPIHSKLLIITTAFNRPDFIEWQDKLFKRFLKEDYEFLVCCDANTVDMQRAMQGTCQRLGLRFLQVPQNVHWLNTPSGRNATAIYYAMSQVGNQNDDLVVVIDSDMFLTRPFSFREYLGDYWAAAVPQQRGHVRYMWVGLMIFNMPKLPEPHLLTYSPGIVEGVDTDTGGFTYNYLISHPQVKWREMQNSVLNVEHRSDLDEPTKNLIQTRLNAEFLIDYHFLHYAGGSAYAYSADYHRSKSQIIFDYLQKMYDQGAEDLTHR